jgi:hypothetical protein
MWGPPKKKKKKKKKRNRRAKNVQKKLQGAMGEVLQYRKSLRDADKATLFNRMPSRGAHHAV